MQFPNLLQYRDSFPKEASGLLISRIGMDGIYGESYYHVYAGNWNYELLTTTTSPSRKIYLLSMYIVEYITEAFKRHGRERVMIIDSNVASQTMKQTVLDRKKMLVQTSFS